MLTIELDDQSQKKIEELSKLSGQSVNELVIGAIKQIMIDYDKDDDLKPNATSLLL